MTADSGLDAVVVGAGPNGLAAAVTLADAGLGVRVYEMAQVVGGGCRTAEVTLPGYRHDVCSAVHPLAQASPFLNALPLADHGLEWVHPDVPVAHALEGGRAVAIERSLEATVASLGSDGPRYRRLVAPLVSRWDRTTSLAFGTVLSAARHPVSGARFGVRGVRSARRLARRFDDPATRGLLAGLAAHAAAPLGRPFTGGVATVFAATAHTGGWPFARGGSQAIVDALASHLRSLGGEIVTGAPVGSLAQLPRARALLLDVMPGALVRMAGDRLPERYARRLLRYRHGPGVFKVDWALTGPVPWTAEACRRAGTVHVAGTFEEVASAISAVNTGEVSDHPFLIVAQPSVVDSSRAPLGGHTLWGYAHVPNGWDGDLTDGIEARIEAFAPGFRDLVLARSVRGPAAFEEANPNYVGGDIGGGAAGVGLQAVFRPAIRAVPWATPDPAVFLCSSATPPGAGVHGMCGYHAARTALRRVFAKVR